MKLKATKELKNLVVKQDQVVKSDDCAKLKGGIYWCCTRNKWVG